MDQTDNTGHKYGADDEFVIQKIIDIDFGIDYLLRKMSPNDNLIITADHGMASIDENLLLGLDELNKKSPIFDPNLTDSAIFDDPLILVYAKSGKLAEIQINFEKVKKTIYRNSTVLEKRNSKTLALFWQRCSKSRHFRNR